MEGFKFCRGCTENPFRPVSEFAKDKGRKDGLQPLCRACHNKKMKISMDKNRDKVRLRNREYRKNNPEKTKARRELYRRVNPEYQRNYQRGYQHRLNQEDPFALKAMRIASVANVRAKKNGVTGKLTYKEILRLFELFDNSCLACGAQERLHIDHVIPLSKGGSNTFSNLQLLCVHCNGKKQCKSTDYRG